MRILRQNLLSAQDVKVCQSAASSSACQIQFSDLAIDCGMVFILLNVVDQIQLPECVISVVLQGMYHSACGFLLASDLDSVSGPFEVVGWIGFSLCGFESINFAHM